MLGKFLEPPLAVPSLLGIEPSGPGVLKTPPPEYPEVPATADVLTNTKVEGPVEVGVRVGLEIGLVLSVRLDWHNELLQPRHLSLASSVHSRVLIPCQYSVAEG